MKQADVQALIAVATKLRRWMFDAAWPLWSGRGRHSSSRFHETINFDGSPRDSMSSRVRTQARQVYSFALAGEMGWGDGADIVASALPSLLTSGLRCDGVAGRSIDLASGELLDDTADLYDTAFCLLAIAQSREFVGVVAADRFADKLLSSIDQVLGCGEGKGFRETLPAGEARHQNPHMHLFESLLLYYDKSRRSDVRDRAEDVYNFVSATFFDEAVSVVRESVADGSASRGYDPGHSMEWVWLLGYRARLANEALPDFAAALYDRAQEAWREHGWTCLYLDDNNQSLNGTARLWSQAETLKGHLCIAELGDAHAAEIAIRSATRCAQEILDHWLQSEVSGGWLDHFGPDRTLVAEAIPASTGYHLYAAAAELLRVADQLNQPNGRGRQ